jgi:hypothetical protein
MKKLLTIAAFIFAGEQTMAQNPFWTFTNYKGAFPVTDLTPATDWTSGWANWDPQTTAYGAPTTTVSADITANTTWTTGSIVLLQNKIYVKNGATLTIQPGVVIRGEQSSQGALIISRGSKIMAQGTAANPIVFTSDQAPGFRAEGDWGGLVLLGAARNNQPGGIANIEGITPSIDNEFGGLNDADNSGELHYVRIEFPGIALQPNKEINGLTFGSVGSATSVHHIQVSFSGDDSYEWFGGTVDAKYLIAFRGVDDDFDTDFGFSGRVQFALIVRDKDLSDAAGDSNGFESDNDATGSNALPRTMPVFSNVTSIGPKRDGTTVLPVGEKYEKAFRLRRNTATSCHNSLVTGWEKGLSIEGSAAEDNFTGDTAYFKYNVLSNFSSGTAKVTASAAFYASFFTLDGNDTTTSLGQINWVNAFPVALETTPDYRLNTGSTVATGASFPAAIFTGGFVGMEDNNQILEMNQLSVYPNPSNNYINLNYYKHTNGNVNYMVMDLTGKIIFQENVFHTMGTVTKKISVAELNSGMYLVVLQSENQRQTVRIAVK